MRNDAMTQWLRIATSTERKQMKKTEIDNGHELTTQERGWRYYGERYSSDVPLRNLIAIEAMKFLSTRDELDWADLPAESYSLADAMLKARSERTRKFPVALRNP